MGRETFRRASLWPPSGFSLLVFASSEPGPPKKWSLESEISFVMLRSGHTGARQRISRRRADSR